MDRMSIRTSVRALPAYRFTPRPEPVKLDQNESPEDLSAELKQRVLEAMGRVAWNRYPDLTPRRLEHALARRHDWDPDGVVVANGSNVLIQALAIVSALGRSLITVKPTFAVYAAQAHLLDAELVEVPLGPGFALPLEGLGRAMERRSGALFVPNPAAPTGNLHAAPEIDALLDAVPASVLPVLDEAYAEFTGRDHLATVRAHPGAVSLRTLSKAAGLAGVRVGYALTTPETAQEVRKALLPFSVTGLQVAAAEVVLQHPELIEARVAHVTRERARMLAALEPLAGVTAHPSVTNFVLFRVDDPAGVYSALLARGIVIRRQDHLPGAEGCLRVSVGTVAENDAFLAALPEALAAARSPVLQDMGADHD